jgi:hypothetical protein
MLKTQKMRKASWSLLLLGTMPFLSTTIATATAQENSAMSITGMPPDPKYSPMSGTAWDIFLDGSITDKTAAQLDRYLSSNNVPGESVLVLNSPGGSLIGGMELGRVIRKYRLTVYVGRQLKQGPTKIGPGACYSACTLAFWEVNFVTSVQDHTLGSIGFHFQSRNNARPTWHRSLRHPL